MKCRKEFVRNNKERMETADLFDLRSLKKAKGKVHGIIQKDGDSIKIEDEYSA